MLPVQSKVAISVSRTGDHFSDLVDPQTLIEPEVPTS